MDDESLKRLEHSFENEEYKDIYLYLLKFFNTLEDLKKKKDFIKQFLIILNHHYDSLVFKEKDKILEKSINEIYQKSKLFSSSKLKAEERKFFFKKQIYDLFLREFDKIIDLLNETQYSDLISPLISFFFANIQYNLTNYLPTIFDLYKNEIISVVHLKSLINPLFDKFPRETLIKIIEHLERLNQDLKDKTSAKFNQDIYMILSEYSEIFPEMYYEKLDFFINELLLKQEFKFSSKISLIINKIVENRPGLFISKFFDLLSLLNNLNVKDKEKIKDLLEVSLKTIFIHNSYGLFEHFKKVLNEDFNLLFDLMGQDSIRINDVLYEFFIEYLSYIKTYYFNGKITKELLELYLKILEFTLNKGLSNEYLLLSLTVQLQLEEFHDKVKNLNQNLEKKELEKYYRDLIEQIRNYIEIIF